MEPRTRFLLGGAGAILPIAINILIVDPNTVFSDLTREVFLGWLTRILVLFLLGGFYVAYFNKKVEDRLQAIQLGIIAPMVIVGMLNGTLQQQNQSNDPTSRVQSSSISWVSNAHAAQPRNRINERDGQNTGPSSSRGIIQSTGMPFRETRFEQFWRGLTGIKKEQRLYRERDRSGNPSRTRN